MAGVDEVGRGPLAGPVVAAAFVFHQSPTRLEGLDDSKKLSPKKREHLYALLTSGEHGRWSVGEATVEEIEEHNILVASQMAMKRALEALGNFDGVVLVDGPQARHLGRDHIGVVKGDGLCPSIAAASVVAKVTRDRILFGFSRLYPQYGFATNQGYGTASHLRALAEHGPCPIHRRSFLRIRSAPLA